MYVMETHIRPYYRQRRASHQKVQESPSVSEAEKAEERRKDARDREILRTMWTMIPVGLGIFLGGFGVWALDNIYCSKLRVWRREIGLPWGILLEGHGWWYVLSTVDAFLRHSAD